MPSDTACDFSTWHETERAPTATVSRLMAKAMTAKQFTDALDEMGITSHTAAAAVLGISRRSVIRYVYGTQDVPESVRRLIVMLIKHGIPKEWM